MSASEYDELWAKRWHNVSKIGPLTHSRFRIIMNMIFKGRHNTKSLVDVGCGNGVLLSLLRKKYPLLKLYGVESSDVAIADAPTEIRNVIQKGEILDLKKLFVSPVDLVVCSEVLEHVENVDASLASIRSIMHKDSFAILSVPAQMNYWSQQDEVAKHKRRFELEDFKRQLELSGFIVEEIFLWGRGPLAYAYNLMISGIGPDKVMENGSSPLALAIAKMLQLVFRIEDYWPGKGGFQLFAKIKVKIK